MKHYNDTIGNRTRDLPTCSAVKILVITELKVAIFRKTAILILTVSGLPLFNRLKDNGNYTYHKTLRKVKNICILFTECTGVLHNYDDKKQIFF